MLWEFATFYGLLDWTVVFHACDEGECLEELAILAAQLHTAPRILLLGERASVLIAHMCRSILAGCLSSTRLAKAVPKRPLVAAADVAVTYSSVYTSLGAHVDDTNQLHVGVEGTHWRDAFEAAIAVGTELGEAATSLGLVFSDKSIAVGAPKELVKAVADTLQKAGMPLTPARSGVDLSVGAPGARRSVAKPGVRFGTVSRRAKGVRKLHAKVKAVGKRLHQGGV